MAGAHRRPSAKPRRITLLVVLCALAVVTSWLLLPAQSRDADRTAHNPAPGAGAGNGSFEDERGERGSRHDRLEQRPSPSPSKPSPSPSRPEPLPTLTGDAALEARVIELVNVERLQAGCGRVRPDEKLRDAARAHSADMARHDRLDHTGSDGSSFVQRAERAGYQGAMGENIAMGYRTPRDVMDAWMKSKGHRDNILNCGAKAVGMGLERTRGGTPYWTQVFGRV